MVLLVAAAVGNPFSHRGDPLHPLLVAFQAGVIAFIVHMSADWDWDMAAVGTLVFVLVAVCVSYRVTRAGDERRAARRGARRRAGRGASPAPAESPRRLVRARATSAERPYGDGRGRRHRARRSSRRRRPGPTSPRSRARRDAGAVESAVAEPEPADAGRSRRRTSRPHTGAHRPRRLRWAPRAVACVALVLLAVSWLPPYLAGRAENAALAASSDGKVTEALSQARRAASLDPLAVSPLLTEATLLQQVGRNREALARLQEAAKLQPQNYEVWYALGVLLHGALGRDREARAALTRALALNPLDAASRYELESLAQ